VIKDISFLGLVAHIYVHQTAILALVLQFVLLVKLGFILAVEDALLVLQIVLLALVQLHALIALRIIL
jgi:hypothetical protein